LTADVARAWLLSVADLNGPREELHMPMPEMPEKTKKAQKTSRTLERQKYTRGTEVLWLYLLDTGREGDTQRYRIRWNKLTGKKSETGVSAVFSALPEAKTAWAKVVQQREGGRWKPAPIGLGRRTLVIKPIPA
jgi:hypothetical protein